ncbi:YtxH domain-containing protein [Lacticaseibacillus porcinae]|uniref:YtxH domain-containing protein n=1 Tax=Lacticaseibacillus porcinae TaxID=1123687 RepID=UPI000F76843F|nr:YtxH domain-containing protein [Lacticaseibacillus porcinae]
MAKKSHFLFGFILGAASALATTYLLTPQTSDELKHKFNQKKDDLADRAADYYDYAKDATADWRESAADLVDNLKARTQHDDGDLADYDAKTQALKDELTDAPEVADSDEFDDIVLDGKSAFAQAKDAEAPAEPEAPAEEAAPEAETEDKPEDPEA